MHTKFPDVTPLENAAPGQPFVSLTLRAWQWNRTVLARRGKLHYFHPNLLNSQARINEPFQ